MSRHPDAVYLKSHGLELTPDQLDALIVSAVADLKRTLFGPSDHELTQPEAVALEQGGFDPHPRPLGGRDPLARTVAEYAALINTSLTTAAAAQRLGVNVSRIRQRLAQRSLYGFQRDGQWLLPLFQFDDRGVLPNLPEVLAQLSPGLHPVSVQAWFLTPDTDLADARTGMALTPRQWLMAGYPPAVPAEIAAGL